MGPLAYFNLLEKRKSFIPPEIQIQDRPNSKLVILLTTLYFTEMALHTSSLEIRQTSNSKHNITSHFSVFIQNYTHTGNIYRVYREE